MKDYIKALKEVENEDETFKLTLSKKEVLDLVKEIERLTELCNKYEEEHKTTFETWQKDIKENEQLHSIIKEVREKLNNYTTRMEVLNYQISDLTKKELLEILDKVEKENDIEFDVLKALNTDLDDDVEMG